jgi:hypothetical protein
MATKGEVQGEGNYEAARRYDEQQKKFVESGKVREAAENAAPESAAEEREMQEAEDIGRSRAKEEDPAVTSGKPVQKHP